MKSFISSSRLLRTRRVNSGKKALERWLAAEPPQQDLIASYRVRSYTDRDGDQVLSIDVVPTTAALVNSERRRRLFSYTRELTHQAWRQAPGYLNVVNVVSRQPACGNIYWSPEGA